MTPVFREIIRHPAAFTARSLPRGKEDLVRTLTDQELAGFDALLAKTRSKPIQAATRADFDEPGVNALLREVRDVIEIGRGAIILRGVTPERYSTEEMERIYWGVGTHLGVANVQSAAGDRLGYVEEDESNAVKRGYRSSGELHWHTDSPETIGLMCIRKAASGGLSGIVSTLAIHNEILRTRPDLLESLYEGYYYAIPELKFTDKPVTQEKIPVFSNYDGIVSCMIATSFMREAAKRRGESLGALGEALDLFMQTADRDDIALRFMLEPGEMMLWNNYLFLHCRSEFENSPTQKRLLLRHWLDAFRPRQVAPAMHARIDAYKWAYREARARTPA
jgi:hypothetical protein